MKSAAMKTVAMKSAKTNVWPANTINPLSGKPIPAMPFPVMPSAATGPTTLQGKAIVSRNATSHGLFGRDIVLPSLGEDPEGYRQLAEEFSTQLAPRNLLERHYVEKIAAASWRLRRLHRWQAQLFEDDTLTEDERLDRLDKVLRHETALHRQIDTAVKMLNKDVAQLYKSRARDQALLDTMQTEAGLPGKSGERTGK